jgi:hypothetical protein
LGEVATELGKVIRLRKRRCHRLNAVWPMARPFWVGDERTGL